MDEQAIQEMMRAILVKQGKSADGLGPETSLRDLSFRSLDFSELCLRVEDRTQKELNFEAAELRRIETVADVCRFIVKSLG